MLRLRSFIGALFLFLCATTAEAVPVITIAPDPGGSPGGYIPLATLGIPPLAGVGDDTVTNVSTPSFSYAGQSWTSLGISSNGYVVIGGASLSADNSIFEQAFPVPFPPNNVLAPFWTDLDPTAGGGVWAAVFPDGHGNAWLVIDWNDVPNFGEPSRHSSFQIWIGLDGDASPEEDITFVYGPMADLGAAGFASVGAEDATGTVGAWFYYDGAGTIPTEGLELRVSTSGFADVSDVPEPATFALLSAGLLGLIGFRRRARI